MHAFPKYRKSNLSRSGLAILMRNTGLPSIFCKKLKAVLETGYFEKSQFWTIRAGMYETALSWQHAQKKRPKYSQYL